MPRGMLRGNLHIPSSEQTPGHTSWAVSPVPEGGLSRVAVIKLDLDRVLGPVDRRILGGFTEHLGRCIYGGVFDEGSPLSDAEGFRTDVIEAVRRLKPPLLRWPGGNFVSGYHFADGIGPVSSRPRRMDLAWHAEESNRF